MRTGLIEVLIVERKEVDDYVVEDSPDGTGGGTLLEKWNCVT